MNIFKGLIKCKLCGKNYNYKNDHGTKYYICSGYKNYGINYCPRNQLKLEDLLYIIKNHCDIKHKELELTKEGIRQLIDKIEVYGEDKLKILWKDGEITEWSSKKISF